MNQYYVIEIKRTQTGDYEHEVHWQYDTDPDKARLKAESKYHDVLSKAAVSVYASHSATLLSGDGRCLMSMCYRHEAKGVETDEE